MLAFLFNFLFFFFFLLFSLLRSRVRVIVISQSHCHTSVTSDDMVTETVTSHKITEKDIKGSKRMMTYNVYNIY